VPALTASTSTISYSPAPLTALTVPQVALSAAVLIVAPCICASMTKSPAASASAPAERAATLATVIVVAFAAAAVASDVYWFTIVPAAETVTFESTPASACVAFATGSSAPEPIASGGAACPHAEASTPKPTSAASVEAGRTKPNRLFEKIGFILVPFRRRPLRSTSSSRLES
jgi:hypothetical protein